MAEISAPLPSNLADELAEELPLLSQFCSLLEQERELLSSNDLGALSELLARKKIAAERLHALHQLRTSWIGTDGARVKTYLQKHAPQLLPQWDGLLELGRHANTLNQLIGQIITTRLHLNEQALHLMMHGTQLPDNYTPDGLPTVETGPRHLGSA